MRKVPPRYVGMGPRMVNPTLILSRVITRLFARGLPGGSLTNFPCELRLPFFLRRGGVDLSTARPGYAFNVFDHVSSHDCLHLVVQDC